VGLTDESRRISSGRRHVPADWAKRREARRGGEIGRRRYVLRLEEIRRPAVVGEEGFPFPRRV
jgi:hypothetical protein